MINHVGILSAMPEEVGTILNNIESVREFKYGDLSIFNGNWSPPDTNKNLLISTAWSGWGKVSSARAATRILGLNNEKIAPVDLLIFTGVAGGIDKKLSQWDIILPDKLLQYDMDARPIFEKYNIPSLNKKFLTPDTKLHKFGFDILKDNIDSIRLEKFNSVSKGLIGTADKFVSSHNEGQNLKVKIPSLLAVEMEGAAVAQVATQENIPWLIVRVISDSADDSAAQNFDEFLKEYKKYSWNIIEIILEKI